MRWLLQPPFLQILGYCLGALSVAQLPTPGGAEFLSTLGIVVFVATLISLYYQILANRRKAIEPHDPHRRILPHPLDVREWTDPVTGGELEALKREWRDDLARIEKESELREARFERQFESLNRSLQSLSKELHRAVGVLEGRTDHPR
jgi:hypothetical protein